MVLIGLEVELEPELEPPELEPPELPSDPTAKTETEESPLWPNMPNPPSTSANTSTEERIIDKNLAVERFISVSSMKIPIVICILHTASFIFK